MVVGGLVEVGEVATTGGFLEARGVAAATVGEAAAVGNLEGAAG